MGFYFTVLFIIIIVSLITGIFLNIYDSIRIKKHVNNKDNSLSKTIRINRIEGLDTLIDNDNITPIITEKKEPKFIFYNEQESKSVFNNYNEELEVI